MSVLSIVARKQPAEESKIPKQIIGLFVMHFPIHSAPSIWKKWNGLRGPGIANMIINIEFESRLGIELTTRTSSSHK